MNRRGEAAESLAANFLRAQGLAISERNYRCRFGELDLIAREGATLVASITAAKRARLIAAARHYLARQRSLPPCRFDAVLIHGFPPRIEWIRNAFGE